ncbi:MAG: hypothetical protein PHE29_05175, partial [Tissierellia bacterium]|nr:hypothetical protein [Tissierellia bacterium]
YAVNIFILLIILSFILKLDSSKYTVNNPVEVLNNKNQSDKDPINEYVDSLESKIENMISKIEGINSVDVMIYTRNSPILEPIYDVNSTSETNTEVGSDGTKREIKRDTNQNQVVKGNGDKIIEKYFKYPEITGVLIVVDYTGNKNINTILLNSVKTLFNIKVNNIEIVLSND